MHRTLNILFCALLCLPHKASCKVIIWDLGDTLFATSHLVFARKIGISKFIGYALSEWRSPNIKPMVFDILERMNPSEENPKEVAVDNNGTPMPLIMNRWLAGLMSGEEVISAVHDYFEHLDAQKYFASKKQRSLVLKTIEQLFNPKTLVEATKPIMKAIKLLHDCYHAENADGTPKNQLFVLSNWDTVSFDMLKERYADIFHTYFDEPNIIISGAIGLIKPQKAAFEYVLHTYELDPHDCIFIDDQRHNTDAAESVGITAIIIDGNYKKLRKKLIELGAL